ncbi:hypothetical protein ACFOOK_26240 [Micromonospora krabiensis]|nr:hypothetical protein [Micromonospora krabiensis]
MLDTDTNEMLFEGYEANPDSPMDAMNRIVVRWPVNSIVRAPLSEPPPVESRSPEEPEPEPTA